MSTLHEQLLSLWPRKLARWQSQGLNLFNPELVRMEVLPNPERPQSWYLKTFNKGRPTRDKPAEGGTPEPPRCPFDGLAEDLAPEDYVAVGDRYIAATNMQPSQPRQLLLPLREHRAQMLPGDLAPVVRASRETGYHFGASKRGSGIGRIDDHFHFQGYIIPMPVVTFDYRPVFEQGRCSVQTCSRPYFVVRLEHTDADVLDAVLTELTRDHQTDRLVQWLPGELPYNLLVAEGVVYVVPRTAELPSERRWVPFPQQTINDNWKFGCAEVAGLFFPRTIEQYRSLTSIDDLAQALQDVTLTDPSRQQALATAFAEEMRRRT